MITPYRWSKGSGTIVLGQEYSRVHSAVGDKVRDIPSIMVAHLIPSLRRRRQSVVSWFLPTVIPLCGR